jgi:hypothetical protein
MQSCSALLAYYAFIACIFNSICIFVWAYFSDQAMTDKQAETAPAGKLFHFIFSVACYQG